MIDFWLPDALWLLLFLESLDENMAIDFGINISLSDQLSFFWTYFWIVWLPLFNVMAQKTFETALHCRIQLVNEGMYWFYCFVDLKLLI